MNMLFTSLSRVLIIVLLLTSVAISAFSQGVQVPRNKGTIPGATYGYLEYLPPNYLTEPTKKFPAIIFLHGVGEKGNGTTDLTKLTAGGPPKIIKNGQWPVKSPVTGLYPAENFVVISPQSANGYHTNSVLNNFIVFLKGYYRIDPDRTYLVGLSAGGISTWDYLRNYSTEIAASIAVCGNGNAVSASSTVNCVFKHIPIWAFHGSKDTTVDPYGSINGITSLNKCVPAPNPKDRVTIYPNVTHDSWTRTYDLTGINLPQDPKYDPFDMSIYDWLLQFKRGAAPSILPSANAGIDITLTLPSSSTNITGTGTPGTGTITGYAWTQVSGPAATMTNTTLPTVSLSGLVTGIYTFRLTVTNSATQTATDDVKVTVVSANLPPVANAGADIPITLPTNSLTINGTGTDVDGTIASYAWTKVSGPTATLAGQTTANLSLSALLQGTYVFSLKVTDNQGATATDNVTVTVNPAAVNQLPTANAGVDKTVNLPTSTANLSGSGSDPDGTVSTYLWEKVSGPSVTLANANTSTLSLSALVAGVYVFRITVTDNQGATDTDDATVTVIASNQSPVANANSDISITLPTNTTNISGSGNDPDGTIATYAWNQVSGPNTSTLANNQTPTLTAGGLIAGVYTFRLTVTDDDGATGFDDVKVTVNAAPVNVPPTANAGADKTITLPTNMITLAGTGNDPDGTITYAWVKVSGPAATLTNQTTASLTASGLVAGTYVFKLTVTDNQSASASDNVTVTVQPAIVNQAPVTNAGGDVTLTLPANSTTIVGSATDADGTVASYAWTKVSGPAATLTGQTTSTLQLTGLVAGTYVFQLTATDDKGATDSDNVTVTVNAANTPPTANAGTDITINLPTNSTVINGSGTDSDGTVSSYAWTQVSGPSSATLTNQSTSSLTASGMLAGTYTFRLTVTDNNSATGTDDVKVIVNAANQTPNANAGTDKSITLPTNTINVTGAGTDTDGTITSYAWTQLSGPATAILANQNTPTVTITTSTDGIYFFRLTITDNGGASDFDDMKLTVNAGTINQAPTANAGANQSITLPINSLTLTGTGSDPDPTGAISAYQWTKFSGPTATLTNATSSTLSLSNLIEGTYVFRLTVTDNGLPTPLTAFDDVTVTVLPAAVNQPPTASAGTDKTITLPTNTITLFGSASDPDGTVLTYSWTKVTGPAGTLANETTPNLSLSNLVQGSYVLRLMVTDEDGATDFDEVTVTVNAVAANQSPVANAGTDKTLNLPTNSLTLSGSGSDADGSIATYAWVKVSGPSLSLGAVNQAALSVTNLVAGVYVFRLEVTDDDGATDTDDVTVTVLPQVINQTPVVSAGADKSLFLPANTVIIVGSATDADGSITLLQWTKVSGGAATLVNETTSVLTVDDLVAGSYVFRLTATDDKGATAFDEVSVVVNTAAANQPPVADAGPDISLKLPANSTSVAGSGTDADGTITTFLWSKLSGPACTEANQNTATLSLTNLVEGSYVYELTVTDDDGATHFDQVTIEVLPSTLNAPPVVNAGGNVIIALPENTAILSGTATDDGTITEISWTKTSGPAATLSGEFTSTLTLSDLVEGVYAFRLQAKDDGGLTAFDDVTVTVLPETGPPPPTVSAGEDQEIQLPLDEIEIVAIASASVLIDTYEWSQTGGNPVAFETDGSILKLTGLAAGVYSFKVTIKDELGQEADDEVTVIVNEATVKPYNLFSPNNDTENDKWTIPNAELLDNCDIIVYNRQGQKVFQSKGYPIPWDGTLGGKQLPEGVYIYVIRCSGQKSLNGSVTIIR